MLGPYDLTMTLDAWRAVSRVLCRDLIDTAPPSWVKDADLDLFRHDLGALLQRARRLLLKGGEP